MAAKQPYLVSDLIAKYGWQVMVYLSNLGINLLSESAVLFVDSGHAEASDADDTVHGHKMDMPLATIDFAIGLCTANQGDVILVAPGHAETITGATGYIQDVAGVTVIGIGVGTLRPTLSLGTATAATLNITASNCRFSNIRVISALANIAAGITIGASADGSQVDNCDIRDGNSATLELVIGISVVADADDIVIKDNTFSTVPSGGCANAIKFAGGCDRARVTGNTAYGTYSAGAMLASAAASTETVITDNIFVNEGAVALALNASTTGLLARNSLGGTTSIAAALTGDTAIWCFENYVTGSAGASGIISPTVDTD